MARRKPGFLGHVTPGACVGVAIFAALVQAAFVLESHRDPAYRFPLVDAATYHKQALAIATGRPSPAEPFWQPPLYPYALALLYAAGDPGMLPARLLQGCLLGVAAAVLTLLLAGRFVGPVAAAACGAAVALHGPLMFFFSQLLPTGLAVTLDLAAVLMAVRFIEKPCPARAVVCGAVFGLAALAVPNILVVVPAVVLFAWRSEGSEASRPAVCTAVLLLATGFAILPVTLRNVAVSGQWVPISTNAGINLFLGNHARSDETLTARPGSLEWGRIVAEPFTRGAAANAAEADRYFRRRVLEYARAAPGAFLSGLGRKARQVLSSREAPRNLDLYGLARRSQLLRLVLWRAGPFCFPLGVLLPLALAGVVTAVGPAAPVRGFLACAAVLYAASIVAFFPASRYAAPIVPWLVVLAAAGLRGLLAPSGRGRAIVAWSVLAAGSIVVNLPVAFATDKVNFESELETCIGAALQTRGRQSEAVVAYQAAVDLDPENADALFYMGTAFRELGRPEVAIACHRQVLALRPDHHRAMSDLAVLLYERGETAESVRWLRASIALDPANRRAMRNLAAGLAALGQTAEAAEWLRRSQQTRPGAAGHAGDTTP